MGEKKIRRPGKFMGILILLTVVCILAGSARYLYGFFSPDKAVKEKGKLDAFEKIELDLDLGNVQILRGEDFSWSGKFPSKLMPKLEVSGDRLVVWQKKATRVVGVTGSEQESALTIVIPEGTTIRSLDVNMDLGEFSSEDIAYGEADLDLDLGSVILKGCSFDELDADVDVGSIEIDSCDMEKAELKTDLGSITVDGQDQGKSYSR